MKRARAPRPVQPLRGLTIFVAPCRYRLRVTSPADLESKLRSDFTGCIYIPADVTFDMSGCKTIPVHTGIWLIGEHGALGSRPTLKVDTPGPFSFLAVGGKGR